jgi:hypothetical protein
VSSPTRIASARRILPPWRRIEHSRLTQEVGDEEVSLRGRGRARVSVCGADHWCRLGGVGRVEHVYVNDNTSGGEHHRRLRPPRRSDPDTDAGLVVRPAVSASERRNPPGALLLGAAYGAGLWALQRYVFLPINTPEDKLFATNMISPRWVAHVVLGTTAGLVYLLFAQRRLAAVPSLHHVREPHVHRVA